MISPAISITSHRIKIEPAERFLAVAQESFERLAAAPGVGRLWESRVSRLQGVRVYPMPGPYRSYLIFYREIENGIDVLAVLHGARDLGSQLGELLE